MSSDWWSRRLTSTSPAPQTRTSVPATTPAIKFPIQNQPSINIPQQQTETPATMGEAIRVWKGGEAMRKEGNMRCPDCGSQHVFTRVGSGTTVNGAQPAPRCFECGWNGKYSQADQTNWAL
jgi:hypothetical protein